MLKLEEEVDAKAVYIAFNTKIPQLPEVDMKQTNKQSKDNASLEYTIINHCKLAVLKTQIHLQVSLIRHV